MDNTVCPAIKCRMGDLDYYLLSMNARSISSTCRVVDPTKDKFAGTKDINDIIQRKLNLKRVQQQIAPYLVENKDRLWSSLIVVNTDADFDFDPIGTLGAQLPTVISSAFKDNVGLVTLSQGQLIALDGQHRLKAIQMVMNGEVTGHFSNDVPKDNIPLLAFHSKDAKKLRAIFTDTNRYAKPTTSGQNRMMDERDLCAIVGRRLLSTKTIDLSDINYESNTLNPKDPRFTTLATIYEVNDFLLRPPVGSFEWKTNVRQETDVLKNAYAFIEPFWTKFLKFKPFKEFLSMPKESTPQINRRATFRSDTKHKWSFLFKPAAQVAFLKALIFLSMNNKLDEAISRAEDPKMDWSYENPIWQDVMVNKNKTINAGKVVKDFTAQLIRYMLSADTMKEGKIREIAKKYNEYKGNDEKLPDPLGLVKS